MFGTFEAWKSTCMTGFLEDSPKNTEKVMHTFEGHSSPYSFWRFYSAELTVSHMHICQVSTSLSKACLYFSKTTIILTFVSC